MYWQFFFVSMLFKKQFRLISLCACNTDREIHSDGLPPSYTIILLLRLLPDTPSEPFDIWQISDKNNNPEVGVTMNRRFQSLLIDGRCDLVKFYNIYFFLELDFSLYSKSLL